MKLPPRARSSNVRLRWWQPAHGGRLLGDWSLDNVVIGGALVNPGQLISNLPIHETKDDDWIADDNVHSGPFCGQQDAAVGKSNEKEAAILSTRDISVKQDHVLQFSINVGCGNAWNGSLPPVGLQYSTDHGVSWTNVIDQCTPNSLKCKHGPDLPSIYFATPQWQRVVIPITNGPVSRYEY